MEEPKIGIVIFKNQSENEFMSSGKTYIGNAKQVHCFVENDIILLQNIESKCIFGIAQFGAYDSGKIYFEHHLLDMDLFGGSNVHHNKYEIKIKNFKKVNIPFEDLALLCGKPVNDRPYNNIWRGNNRTMVPAQYSGEDPESVMKRLRTLIKVLMNME